MMFSASSSPEDVVQKACGTKMRLATTLLTATAFVDLDSIREEPSTPRNFDRDAAAEDDVFFNSSTPSCSSYSLLNSSPSTSSSPLKFMESLQRKRKSMFRRNQSSSCLVAEKRRTFRRPSLPSIPPTIEEMSSSVGHARSRRPSLHNDWTNEHQRERSANGMLDFQNRIHNIDIEPPVNYFIAIFKDIDESVENIGFDFHQRLYEVFEPYLRIRGLTVNDVQFFLEKSASPIPENAEARYLAGQKIFVKDLSGRSNMKVVRHTRAAHSMDESNDRATRKMSAEAVSRKSSFVNSRILNRGSRNHSGLNGSDDAECRSNDSSLSVRDACQYDEPSCSEPDDGGTRRARSVTSSRISQFFSKDGKDTRGDMIRLLNQMNEDMIVSSPQSKLEKDWREIVNNWRELSDKSTKQQEAIWEIVTTEHRYIKLLRYLSDLSLYLQNLQSSGFLKEIENRFVFSNFSQLHHVNYEYLWTPSIEPMLSQARESGEPLDLQYLYTGFRGIVNWSRCYTDFHLMHSESLKHIQKRFKDNEQFRDFVTWAESQENMDRQKLIDTLSQPMQRLTRYNLLLKALLKVTADESEREMLRSLVETSERATMQLNWEMNNNDLRARLGDIMRTIEGPDFVDPDEVEKIFRVRSPLNLVDFMLGLHPRTPTLRTIFHKGDLRMQEGKKGSKIDVHCMIFTDMFLICRKVQAKKDRLKIVRPPIHLDKLVFHAFPDHSGFNLLTLTDFQTAASLLYMHCSCIEETQRWTDMLKMAGEELKNIRRNSWAQHEQDSPSDEYGRGYFMEPPVYAPPGMLPPGYSQNVPVIHRKCSSMDSQAVAAHAHLNYMHRSSAVSSTEQLNRHHNGLDSKCTPPRHKLSVASCHANPLSSSKSSVDLYVSMGAENGEEIERPRSRSNSSGPDIEGLKNQRSRSPSPARKDLGTCTPQELNSPVTTTPCRDSPTLLITSDDSNEPAQSSRRYEKRYHTTDVVDVLKPKVSSSLSGQIIKRLSLNMNNLGSAVSGSSRKRLESSRRSSQVTTAASVDSFGSSTSGISTASSNNNNDPTMEVLATKLSHISTISINDTPIQEPQATLSINLDAPPVVLERDESIELSVPPPPDLPPPSKTPSPNLPSSHKSEKNEKNTAKELMKFIMDSQLETSDV